MQKISVLQYTQPPHDFTL